MTLRNLRYFVNNSRPGYALREQNMRDDYEFPFTLNLNVGCIFGGCKYCYVREGSRKWGIVWGRDVRVKARISEKLDWELSNKYRDLPQHLKRVQVGNACEVFDPKVLSFTQRELNRDLVRETLEVFENHWNNGNYWMIHLVTKSHYVTRYLDILERMRQMVQIEMTLVCPDEELTRQFELYSSSVEKRLRGIRQLSDAGVFVRIMAMPFMWGRNEARELRRIAFQSGARGFKHKSLNYFDRSNMLRGVATRVGRRNDVIFDDVLLESGEPVDGQTTSMDMPIWIGRSGWGEYVPREMPTLRSGYSELNDINWGYLI
jgi:DNA repair photolyase